MLIIQLIVLQVVTFTALILVLRKILYSASFNETKRLQQLNQENVKKAKELAAKIIEAEKEHKEKIATIEEEARKMKSEAKEEIERLRQDVLNKAKQESERIVNQALSTKDRLRQDIESGMEERNIERSIHLISQILNSKNQKLVHEGFIIDIIEEIENITPQKLKLTTDKGEIVVPFAMDESKREKIIQLLSDKTGRKISLQEKIDKEVIAGVTIKLGNLVIDGSLSGKLREIAEKLKRI